MKLSGIIITLLAAMGISVGGVYAQNAEDNNVLSVSPQEFKSRLQADTTAYLLDVRRADEFAAGHLAGAHQLNWLDSTTFDNGAKQLDKSKTIYVYYRSGLAAHFLAAQGFKVVNMKGGYLAWTANSLEIKK